MNRIRMMKSVWFVLVEMGERPSRRSLQDMLGRITGKKWATDEVHAFLRAWQYRGQDGLFYLRKDLGPVQVHARSSSGPTPGPESEIKNDDLGPVEDVTQVQARSPRADLQTENTKEKIRETSSHELALTLQLTPPPEAKKPRRFPSEQDLAAYKLLDAVLVNLKPELQCMTAQKWRTINKHAALDMHQAGITPERAAQAWLRIRDIQGKRFILLGKLQEAMQRESMQAASTPQSLYQRHDPYAAIAARRLTNVA